jgi:hypothetical protein
VLNSSANHLLFLGLVSLTKLLFKRPKTSKDEVSEESLSRSGFGTVLADSHGGVYCKLVQYHYQYLHSQLAGRSVPNDARTSNLCHV